MPYINLVPLTHWHCINLILSTQLFYIISTNALYTMCKCEENKGDVFNY